MSETHVTSQGLSMVLTRSFSASLDAIWSAWTDPTALAKWWGPHGMGASATADVRAGGVFSLTMHATDGIDYPLTGEYVEVVPGKRLVMEMHLDDHPASWHDYLAQEVRKAGGAEDVPPSMTVVTAVDFAEGSGGTVVTVTQTYATLAERDAFASLGNAGGWSQSFEKLDKVLGVS